ncbi:MAG TPA: hypothetical protein VGK33_04290 [Chloroflexota bacterium]
MRVAWTGHRPDLFQDPANARATVESIAREFAEQPDVRFLVGGQRGVDTWAALAAISLGVRSTLVLPADVDTFTEDWPSEDRSMLEQTLAHADEMQIAAGYTARNQYLAQTAHLLVAVWTRTPGGGTAETLAQANAANTPIREIVLPPSPTAATAHGRGI